LTSFFLLLGFVTFKYLDSNRKERERERKK
jgi:hypothetical protein